MDEICVLDSSGSFYPQRIGTSCQLRLDTYHINMYDLFQRRFKITFFLGFYDFVQHKTSNSILRGSITAFSILSNSRFPYLGISQLYSTMLKQNTSDF